MIYLCEAVAQGVRYFGSTLCSQIEVVRLVNKCERNHHEGARSGLVAWFWTINEKIDQILKRVHLVSLKHGNEITTP